jgi:diguanylate cyclase (GGDEF)-like protein
LDGKEARIAPPRWRLCRWLVETTGDVPVGVRLDLIATLFRSSPAFVGGEVNTALVACIIAAHIPTWPFLLWAMLQTAMAGLRLRVQIGGARAMRRGAAPRPDAYVAVALLWAATIGYGTFISVASGDWVVATLASTSAAAMVGGICFRSFAVPRLVVALIVLVLGPCSLAAILSGEAIMLLAGLQLPLFLLSMGLSAFALNRMLVRTMDAERRNEHRARHDPLTGLLNRNGLAHWASAALARAADGAADGECLAIFYLDLDGFKGVNDSLGHHRGDLCLQGVAERLRGLVGGEDAIARLGGDEFVIIAAAADLDSAHRFGERIVAAIADEPFLMGDLAASIGASIGGALHPAHGLTLETLLLVADRALYEAKSAPEPCCIIAPSANPLDAPPVLDNWASRTAA